MNSYSAHTLEIIIRYCLFNVELILVICETAMASDLPDKFDVIVLGTGLPETLLAAAFSRNGLSVLHLDRNAYYCGNWASFSLRQVPAWIEEQKRAECYTAAVDSDRVASLLKEGEKAAELPKTFPTVLDPHCQYFVEERPKNKDSGGADSLEKPSTRPTIEFSGGDKQAEALESVVPPLELHPEESSRTDHSGHSRSVPGQFDSIPDDGETATPDDGKTVPDDEKTAEDITVQQSAGKDEMEASKSCDKRNRHEIFLDDIEKEWRKFSLDIAPKLVYCSGSMVELLIVSDVAKYCEFRSVSRVLTVKDKMLEKVPCSRADVFSSKVLSLMEKRVLMKFLTFAAEYDKHPEEYEDFIGKSFVELLAAKKLSPKMQYFVLYSIAMATEATLTEEGLQRTQKFIRSLGRYGNTAFLFPLYGSGELPQGFCRLSAVFGGVYVLTMSVSHLIINNENKCTGVVTSAGQRIECKYLIADTSYLPPEFYSVAVPSCISRGVYITDQSIFPGSGEDLSLLQLPHEGQLLSPVTTVLELPPSAMVTPHNFYVVHATRRSASDVRSDLQPVTSFLFASSDQSEEVNKPKALWSLEFQMKDFSKVVRSSQSPDNVFVVSGPGIELDVDRCVDEAKQIFSVICANEDFLPKPPHPDDIIYVDTEEVSAAGKERGDWVAERNDATADASDVADGNSITSDDCHAAGSGEVPSESLTLTDGCSLTEDAGSKDTALSRMQPSPTSTDEERES